MSTVSSERQTMSKSITVVGGGPAGMMAAITAAEHGAKVTLLEPNDAYYLGADIF